MKKTKQLLQLLALSLTTIISNSVVCQDINRDKNMFKDDTIIWDEQPKSPDESSENSMQLVLESTDDEKSPLIMHAHYNFSMDLVSRYTQSLPAPIQVVAVCSKTGKIYIDNLIEHDDIPASYLGESHLSPFSSEDVFRSQFISVDLKRHLALPREAGTYDVFLWIESYLSDMVRGSKIKTDDHPGGMLYDQPSSIALIDTTDKPEANKLSLVSKRDGLYVTGSTLSNRISIVAFSITSQIPGWTVLESSEKGMNFHIKVTDLLPETSAGEKIMALAIVDGKRLPLAMAP